MKFSIIIPAYNVEKYIGDCLGSLLNQDYPHDDYEIIIVDDASTDGTVCAVKSIVDGYMSDNKQVTPPQSLPYQFIEARAEQTARWRT